MPFFIFFGRTLIAGTDAEYYEINEYYARLRSWITTEVSHILLEELPGIVGRFTDIFIAKFEDQTAIM